MSEKATAAPPRHAARPALRKSRGTDGFRRDAAVGGRCRLNWLDCPCARHSTMAMWSDGASIGREDTACALLGATMAKSMDMFASRLPSTCSLVPGRHLSSYVVGGFIRVCALRPQKNLSVAAPSNQPTTTTASRRKKESSVPQTSNRDLDFFPYFLRTALALLVPRYSLASQLSAGSRHEEKGRESGQRLGRRPQKVQEVYVTALVLNLLPWLARKVPPPGRPLTRPHPQPSPPTRPASASAPASSTSPSSTPTRASTPPRRPTSMPSSTSSSTTRCCAPSATRSAATSSSPPRRPTSTRSTSRATSPTSTASTTPPWPSSPRCLPCATPSTPRPSATTSPPLPAAGP